ncbi:hypothetical protein CNY89_29865, partial [Amaricoccus sp. HAR-UPW-R2A-40]
RWRRFDTAALAVATDGVNRLFSNDNPLLRLGRDLGLGLMDRAGGGSTRRRWRWRRTASTGSSPTTTRCSGWGA